MFGYTFRLLLAIVFVSLFSAVHAQDTACPQPSRLEAGQTAQVVAGGANRIRSEASTNSAIVGEIPQETIIYIYGGPLCAEGYQWWQVNYDLIHGWTAEVGDGDYWLAPYIVPTPSGVIPPLPTPISANAISAQNAAQVVEQERFGSGWVSDIAWSHDGKTLAVATSLGLRLYDVDADTPARELFTQSAQINQVAFSPDGQLLAAVGDDKLLHIWDSASAESLYTQTFDHTVKALTFSPDGRWLAIAEAGQYTESDWWQVGVTLWDTTNKTLVGNVSSTSRSPERLIFTSDGTQLQVGDSFSGSVFQVSRQEGLVELGSFGGLGDWDIAQDGRLAVSIAELHGDGPTVQDLYISDVVERKNVAYRDVSYETDLTMVRFTPRGDLLLTLNAGGQLHIRSLQTLEGMATLADNVSLIAFSEDASLLAAAGPDGTLRLFTTPLLNSEGKVYFEQRQALFGIVGAVKQVKFSPDGTKIAATGADDTVRAWDVLSGEKLVTYRDFNSSVTALAVSGTGQQIGLGTENGHVFVANTQIHNLQAFSNLHKDAVGALAFSPDGNLLVSADQNTTRLWDASSGTILNELAGGVPYDFNFGRFYGRGTLFFLSQDRLLKAGDARQSIDTDDDFISIQAQKMEYAQPDLYKLYDGNAYVASADGHTLVFSDGATIFVVASSDGTLIKRFPINGIGFLHYMRLSADGRLLTLYEDNNNINLEVTITIWDARNGIMIARLDEGDKPAFDLALSADGTVLATGYADGTIRLWDVAANYEITTLHGHTGAVNAIAFSQDGEQLISASSDGTVRLWSITGN